LHSTNIVTSFIKNDDKILILQRSNKVKSMKCLWAGVSGIIEKHDKTPLDRAKTEIREETGINENEIEVLKSVEHKKIESNNIRIMNGISFHFYLKQKIPRSNLIGKIQNLNG